MVQLLGAVVSTCGFEDIQYYMDFTSLAFLFVFNALIIRYGYPIYRTSFWFMLCAIVLQVLGGRVLTLLALVLYIAFYVKLYLTAKMYNM